MEFQKESIFLKGILPWPGFKRPFGHSKESYYQGNIMSEDKKRFSGLSKEEREEFQRLIIALAFKYSEQKDDMIDDILKDQSLHEEQKRKEQREALAADPNNILNKSPRQIKSSIDEYMIGQEEAKKILSVAFFNHIRRINAHDIAKDMGNEDRSEEIAKTSVIIAGPTGTGKSYLVEQLSKLFDIPVYIGDASTITQAGFIGKNAQDFVEQLYLKAGKDKEATERGIIFIDEIDKIAKTKEGKQNSMAEGAQQSLLKIIEGTEVMIESSEPGDRSKIVIDTSNIMFVFAGAFVGLLGEVGSGKQTIGFMSEEVKSDKHVEEGVRLMPSDFIKYGIIPEMMGRISMIARMNSLTEENLVEILKNTKNNIVAQYRNMLKSDDIELEFPEETYNMIAKKAIDMKTGARSLKSIVDYLMVDKIFDIETHGENRTTKIVVEEDYVEEKLKNFNKDEKAEDESQAVQA